MKLYIFIVKTLLFVNNIVNVIFGIDNAFTIRQTIRGVKVYQSSNLMGLFLMYDSRIPSGVAVPKLNCIILSDNFSEAHQDIQDALLYHEVGHVLLQHYSGKSTEVAMTTRRALITVDEVINEELEADAYAVSIIGADRVINAFNLLRDMNGVPPIASYELVLRIKALEDKA
jgi:hypothetical protein